jgi:hypothetical protein
MSVEGIRYHFFQGCLDGDIIDSTINYNPEWDVSYSVIFNNGTYSRLKVDYKSSLSFNVENVTILLDLTDDEIYNENWTLNAEQDPYSRILEIPSVTFTNSYRTLYIDGVADVPYAQFSSFANEEIFTIDESNYSVPIYYKGYMEYTKYSSSFVLQGIGSDWTIDGIHYINNSYTINSTGYFEIPGWDSSITSSYLRFQSAPISNIERNQYDNGTVIYTIDCDLPISSAMFIFYIETEDRFTIITPGNETTFYSYDNRHFYLYRWLNLDVGRNYFTITYSTQTVWDDLILLLAIPAVGVALYLIYRQVKSEREEESEKLLKETQKESKEEPGLIDRVRNFVGGLT